MESLERVTVVQLKRQRHTSNRHHPKKGATPKVTRPTRVKSRSQRSHIDDKQSVPTMGETDVSTVDLNPSPTDLSNNNNNNMKSLPIEPSVFPLIEQKPNTARSSLTRLKSSSRRVTPSNKCDSMQLTTNFHSKSSRLSISDRRSLYTNEKESKTDKRQHRRCLSHSPIRCFALALLVSLFLATIAVVLTVLLTLKTTTTTMITTTTTIALNNSTSTTGTTSTDASTSSASTATSSTISTSTTSSTTSTTSTTDSFMSSTSTTSSSTNIASTTTSSTNSTSTTDSSTSSTSTTSSSTSTTYTTDSSTSSTSTTTSSTSSTSTTSSSTSSTSTTSSSTTSSSTTSSSTSTTSTTDSSTSSTSTTSSSTSTTSTADSSTSSTSTTDSSTSSTSTTDSSTSSTFTTDSSTSSSSTSTTSTTDSSTSSTSTTSSSTSSTSTTSSTTSSRVSTTTTKSTTSSSTSVTTSTKTSFTTTVSTTTAASTVTITSNICTSTISSIQMVSNCFPCPTIAPYYPVVYTYTATSNVSLIAFAFLIQTYYFAVDNVSVRDVTAPNTELLSNGGFETGDLTSWLYCNQNNASIVEGVKANLTYNNFTYYPYGGTYYYLGGSNISADYIIQSFPTQSGHQYNVTLAIMLPVGGNFTSANFFLGA